MKLYQEIKKVLDGKFVFTDEVARALAIAIAGRKNLVIYGPGGHAKSAMIDEVVSGLGLANDTFCQFFGEGMSEDRLYGGLDFGKLEDEKVLEYFPERSFLNRQVAVFEELFDAPAQVLLALKDTLTAKALRNGAQSFAMKTGVIVCLTNKTPAEVAELGPSAQALVERFPLQLELKWDDYSSSAYLQMLEKVASDSEAVEVEPVDLSSLWADAAKRKPHVNGSKAILAEILAEATANGNFVSPRTAVHAMEICQTSALLRGADEVAEADFSDLRFLPGLEGLAAEIQEKMRVATERARAEAAFASLKSRFQAICEELGEASTPIKLLQAAKRLAELGDQLASFKCPDVLTKARNELRDQVSKRTAEAQNAALAATRV